ncbi:MAG: glycosyltransferase [Rubrivivax sp.]|nr:MAG: glycosyltransferase [Rubrivivax sp.]
MMVSMGMAVMVAMVIVVMRVVMVVVVVPGAHGPVSLSCHLADALTKIVARATAMALQGLVPFVPLQQVDVNCRMPAALSITIPAHNEERFIGKCIESVFRSAHKAQQAVEVVVALNRCTDGTQALAESLGARCVVEDTKCISAVRNAAIRASSAPAIVTIDADSWMSDDTIAAVMTHVNDPRYVGGGSMIYPERMSLGIFFSALTIIPYVFKHRLSYGMFWFSREAFEQLGGFDENMITVEDVDFALRLRALGRQRGQQYGTIWRHGITTSCRKFDMFGDWYLFKNPALVRGIFEGDRAAANHFFYDVDR